MSNFREEYTVSTHETAQRLIREACAGARVEFREVASELGRDKSKAYVIILETMGQEPVYAASAYSLPFDAEVMQKEITRKLREVSKYHYAYEIKE